MGLYGRMIQIEVDATGLQSNRVVEHRFDQRIGRGLRRDRRGGLIAVILDRLGRDHEDRLRDVVEDQHPPVQTHVEIRKPAVVDRCGREVQLARFRPSGGVVARESDES